MTTADKRKPDFDVRGAVDQGRRFFEQGLWDVDLVGLSTIHALGLKVTRVFILAGRGLVQHDCLTRASALTYITVLSLVPLLAFAFSMAKGFGAYERLVETVITPFLDQLAAAPSDLLAPTAGAQGVRTAVESVLSFVGNTSFANLGLMGLAALIVAALKLMTTTEQAFNTIWGVPRARPMIRKVADYVTVLAVTPILLLVATTVTVSLQSNAFTSFLTTTLGLGAVVQLLSRLLTLTIAWLGFALLYMIMPNTRVPFVSALVGGIVGGAVWQIVQVLHIQFQIGVANYNAIYAGFAAFPLFLVWIYMNWVAVLLGGVVAWAHQTFPAYRDSRRSQMTSLADREIVALRAAVFIATSFAEGRGPAQTSAVAAYCGITPAEFQDVAQPLVSTGLMALTSAGPAHGLLPARSLSEIRVEHVLQALRGQRHDSNAEGDVVSRTLRRLREAVSSAPDNLTLQELVGSQMPDDRLGSPAPPHPVRPPHGSQAPS